MLYLTLSVSETVQDNGVTFKSGSGVIQGNWKWHHFDRSHTSSYWRSIL